MEDILVGKPRIDILVGKPWRISWKVNYEWIFWYVNHSWYHFSSHLIYRLSQDAKSIHGSSYFSIYNIQIVLKVSHPPLPLKLLRPESKPNQIFQGSRYHRCSERGRWLDYEGKLLKLLCFFSLLIFIRILMTLDYNINNKFSKKQNFILRNSALEGP